MHLTSSHLKNASAIISFAALYFLAARLGLSFASVNPSASPVWPPTGIALALLLLKGSWLWPAILFGAFAANFTTTGAIGVSIGIACGNTLEAVLGAYLLRRYSSGAETFSRPAHMIAFLVLAAFLSTAASALIGVSSLLAGGLMVTKDFWSVLITWWLGNANGAIIFTPMIVLWSTCWRYRTSTAQGLEALLLLVTLAIIGFVAFDSLAFGPIHHYALGFLCIPPVVWVAFRFGQRETSVVLLLISLFTISGTLRGFGPFSIFSANESLLMVQSFIAVLSAMGFTISAAVNESNRNIRALAASQQQLQLLADSVPSLISYVDAQGIYRFNNKAYLHWWNKKPEELTGKHLREAIGDAAFAQIQGYVERALAGEKVKFQHFFPNIDGKGRHVEITYTPDFTEAGGVRGFFASVHDITEHKLLAHQLEIQYLAAMEFSHANDIDGAITKMLKALCNSFAWDIGALWLVDSNKESVYCRVSWARDEFKDSAFAKESRIRTFAKGIGLPGCVWLNNKPEWLTIFADSSLFPRVPAARESGIHSGLGFPITQGGECIGVIELFSRYPRGLDHELLSMYASLGAQVGIFLGQRNAEMQVRNSEMHMRAVLDSAMDCIITTDADGRIIEFNPAAEQTFRFRRDEVIGKKVVEVVVPEHLRARCIEGIARFKKTGEGPLLHRRIEATGRRSDGSEFPVEVAIRPVPLINGQHIFAAYLRDVTLQRQADTALRQRAEQLAEADRHKNEFIAVLGHELRNPLWTIANALQLARVSGQEQQQRAYEVIERQVAMLTRLIDDLLDVSRINKGKIRLQKERVDLVTIARNVIQSLRPLCESRQHQLTVDLPNEPVWLNADPTRIEQILVNLLTNAAKYTEPNGKIVFSVSVQATLVQISVRDNGPGISPDMLSRIFEPFTQASPTVERSQGGLGIGLALVRTLTEMHEGNVLVKSEGLGKGSEFIVQLPVVAAATAAVPLPILATDATTEAHSGAGRRVLVVDDNLLAACMLSELLQTVGYSVKMAKDGYQAIELARSSCPDFVLCDIGLPGMDGYEVIARLKQESKLQHTHYIAISGYGQAEDRQHSLEVGFDVHLVKPVNFSELSNVLSSLEKAESSTVVPH